MLNLHLFSDSTGETLAIAARAIATRFADAVITDHHTVFLRNQDQIEEAFGLITEPALIVHTIADTDLRQYLQRTAVDHGIDCIPLIDPLVDKIAQMTGQKPRGRAGQQHKIDQSYHERIAAVDYAISHDDGQSADRLLSADVILVGVSRTSKTPTCIYLAYQGIRAANVPLVPRSEIPQALIAAIEADIPVIGLIANPNRLVQVRRNRLTSLDRTDTPDYADLETVRDEVSNARLFFERYNLPVIDVTRRSIEETAAAVRVTLRQLKKIK